MSEQHYSRKPRQHFAVPMLTQNVRQKQHNSKDQSVENNGRLHNILLLQKAINHLVMLNIYIVITFSSDK